MKHWHWLRALNTAKNESSHRTRARNDQTSNRYPLEVTCDCGVKTAMARDGHIRPHQARARLYYKHLGKPRTPAYRLQIIDCMNGDKATRST